MAAGNGADLGQVVAMLGEVLSGQAGMRGEMREMRTDIRDIRTDIRDIRDTLAEHDRRLTTVERKVDDIAHGLTSLRQTVVEYHSAVLGHGILISELDARVRRIERHLNLPPAA